MPQGLQVWDAGANLIVDTSKYSVKSLVLVGEVTAPGSATFTALPPGAIIKVANDKVGDNYRAQVSVAGNTVSWTGGGVESFHSRLQVMVV